MSKNICNTTVGAPDSPLVSKPTLKKEVEMTGSAAHPQLGRNKSAQTKKMVTTGQRLSACTALQKETPALV